MKDKTFTAPEGDVHYIDWEGGGPLAVISHATGFCARIYTPLALRLNHRLRVVGPDDRGHGLTRLPAEPKRLKNWNIFAGDMERFIEYLGEPVVLMGHSRGGVAGLKLAVRRPDLIRALILIDPTILPLSWAFWSYPIKMLGLARFIPIAAHAARRRNGWASKTEILESWQGKGPFARWAPGFLEGYIQDGTKVNGDGTINLSCEPAWESRCFATFSHYDYSDIKKLTPPTLVVYGRTSDTFLPAAVRRFERIRPDAGFVGFKDTGHFVPMEKPDDAARVILDFLTEKSLID